MRKKNGICASFATALQTAEVSTTLCMIGWFGGLVAKSCLTLVTPWTIACQAPLSMGFSRQEFWSGLHMILLRAKD